MPTEKELFKALNYLKENYCTKQDYYNCDNCPHDQSVFDNPNIIPSVCPYKRNYDYIKHFIEEQTENAKYKRAFEKACFELGYSNKQLRHLDKGFTEMTDEDWKEHLLNEQLY